MYVTHMFPHSPMRSRRFEDWPWRLYRKHSALFVAMARAVGIPARVAVGVGYWRPGDGLGWHAWAEVFVDGRWYATDPTWGQTIVDATHLQLAGGDLMEQAQIIMLLGNLSIDSMTVR